MAAVKRTRDVGRGVEAVRGEVGALQVGRGDDLLEGRAGQALAEGRQPRVQLLARVRDCAARIM